MSSYKVSNLNTTFKLTVNFCLLHHGLLFRLFMHISIFAVDRVTEYRRLTMSQKVLKGQSTYLRQGNFQVPAGLKPQGFSCT